MIHIWRVYIPRRVCPMRVNNFAGLLAASHVVRGFLREPTSAEMADFHYRYSKLCHAQIFSEDKNIKYKI